MLQPKPLQQNVSLRAAATATATAGDVGLGGCRRDSGNCGRCCFCRRWCDAFSQAVGGTSGFAHGKPVAGAAATPAFVVTARESKRSRSRVPGVSGRCVAGDAGAPTPPHPLPLRPCFAMSAADDDHFSRCHDRACPHHRCRGAMDLHRYIVACSRVEEDPALLNSKKNLGIFARVCWAIGEQCAVGDWVVDHALCVQAARSHHTA